MGQQNSYEAGLNCELVLVEQLPIGKIYKQTSSEAMYFIKEYAYTSQQAFQQAFLKFSAKLTSKNQNLLNLQKTNTKVDNTFCSTFYKIILIFEYVNYSLADEIVVRNKETRMFEEKEIWSILFHCTLGISYLKRAQGIQHSAIGLKDIKLSEDGTIKIIPTQMVGISNQHDLNQGTTKKLAMTILSCILMKQVSNQSCEYLQALIDKTKCSKELKKVLYFMVMDDTTFKQLEDYLFKLANDQNDTLLSGVSTPVYSANKKTVQDSRLKKVSQQSLTKESGLILQPLQPQKEDNPNVLPLFQTFETQNPDETDEKQIVQVSCNQNSTMSIPNSHETHTFSNDNNIDFKLKDYSASHDDVTVRMIGKKNSDFVSFANTSIPEPQPQANGLYTDPKLLDLIKKDLEQIQQKSRISHNALMKQSATSNFKMSSTINPFQSKQTQNTQKLKKNSIYNISTADFNINMRPLGTDIHSLKTQNPQGNVKPNQSYKQRDQLQTNNNESLREIENLPKRSKEQQCLGNILDEDAGFKKAKFKRSMNTATVRQSQAKKNSEKQNFYESSQTKRIVQSYQKNQQSNSTCIQSMKPKQPQSELFPQSLPQTSNMPQYQPSPMQFVNQTYQKGEYKGYKLNGLRHGHGTFYYRQGGKYIGEWKQNKMNGKGTLYYPNDEVAYEGNWKDDQLHGYGTLYNEEVMQLEKSFDYQDWAIVEEYWVKYEGEFAMDNKQGKGKLFLSNGEVFQGNFKEDMVDGEGVLNRDNGSRVRGIWRKNKLLRMY